ncbi:MAG: hypothetical protein AB1648_07205 [Pseudomonadota bacterium]
MSVLDAMARYLSIRGVDWSGRARSGAPSVTPAEFAAMLAGLPAPCYALALAKCLADAGAERRLLGYLRAEAARLAERWDRRTRNRPDRLDRLDRLAELVRDDLVSARKSLTAGESARRLGVGKTVWYSTWRGRHADLLRVGQAWEFEVTRKLRRELYRGEG